MEDEEDSPPLAVQIEETAHESSYSHDNDDVSVGVTVITGFLGAGKSTVIKTPPFLNHFSYVIMLSFCVQILFYSDVLWWVCLPLLHLYLVNM